jgi:YD repeat-containing protein
LNKTVPQGNYTVTAWARGNITVNGSAGNQLAVSKRDGNWRLVSWELTNVTSIQLLADFVDEVRLHPPDAMMTTYTYDPVVGMTGKCDTANGITYYEYDSSGRLSVIRDQDFKIIKSFDYKYKTQ